MTTTVGAAAALAQNRSEAINAIARRNSLAAVPARAKIGADQIARYQHRFQPARSPATDIARHHTVGGGKRTHDRAMLALRPACAS